MIAYYVNVRTPYLFKQDFLMSFEALHRTLPNYLHRLALLHDFFLQNSIYSELHSKINPEQKFKM